MRYAILSDIHGNLEALQAVLASIEGQRVDEYLCLGDIVGYGPQPSECLREVQKHCRRVIAGNHDYAVAEKIGIASFNIYAREAILWTRNRLVTLDVEYLSQLPLTARLDGLDLVHGALYAPELFDYVQTSYDAYLSMARMEAPVCFIGHSHIPITFIQGEIICYNLDPEIRIEPQAKTIVNVGSVGQPRDKDPRASYAIYDTEARAVTIHRVRYDIESTIMKVREGGLPIALGERLRIGR